MYPLGVPTLGGIVSDVRTAYRIFKEAKNASEKLEAAKQVLESVGTALTGVEAACGESDLAGSCSKELKVARGAWKALETFVEEYEVVSRSGASSRKTYKSVAWALNELDGRIYRLYDSLSVSLQVVGLITSQQLLREVSEVRKLLDGLRNEAPSRTSDIPNHAEPALTLIARSELCWKRKGGCLCRCHKRSRLSSPQSRFFFVETFGAPLAFSAACNIANCNPHNGVRIRVATSRFGIPYAFTFDLQSSWLPRLALIPERICRYTSPGFKMLWELNTLQFINPRAFGWHKLEDWQKLIDAALSQKLADIKHLFCSGRATFSDVDPKGEGWLEKLLRHPWIGGTKWAQRELVEFLYRNSPVEVRNKPKLLFLCAEWTREGAHMAMLETLLGLGVEPGSLDNSIFHEWPRLSRQSYSGESSDPMFVEWMKQCLKHEPGFAGCDDISEKVIVGSEHEFDAAICKATSQNRVLGEARNALGQSAVHLAVLMPSRLKRLLELGVDPNAVDAGKFTPLMYAACYGKSESVEILLDWGADPFLVDEQDKRDYLDCALVYAHPLLIEDLVRYYKKKGDSSGAQVILDRAVLACGVRYDWDINTIQRLFTLGASPDARAGNSSLMHLIHWADQRRCILQAGFNIIDCLDDQGITPSMCATQRLDVDSLRYLLERGAEVNHQDRAGYTAMHHAMASSFESEIYSHGDLPQHDHFRPWSKLAGSLHLLIENGAEVWSRDACQCACSAGGCSIATIALHHAFPKPWSFNEFKVISGVPLDLLCILHNRSDSNLPEFTEDIFRYRQFIESGLEHTCCRGRALSSCGRRHNQPVLRAGYGSDHETFQAFFRKPERAGLSVYLELIRELSEFYVVVEAHSLQEHAAAANQLRANHTDPYGRIFEVDERNDTFLCSLNFPPSIPPIAKLDLTEPKAWFTRCLTSNRRLYQKGTIEAYVENGLKILSDVEARVSELRVHEITES